MNRTYLLLLIPLLLQCGCQTPEHTQSPKIEQPPYISYSEIGIDINSAMASVANIYNIEHKGPDFLAFWYLASARVMKDDQGPYWDLTFLAREKHMHNHYWAKVRPDGKVFGIATER